MSVWAKALGVGIVWLCNVGCADAENAVSGEPVVGFSAGTTAQRGEAIVARAGGAIRRHLGAIRAAAVRPRPGRTPADLRAALRGHRAIRYVEPNFDKLPSLQGRIVTGGRLDLDRAMERTP